MTHMRISEDGELTWVSSCVKDYTTYTFRPVVQEREHLELGDQELIAFGNLRRTCSP